MVPASRHQCQIYEGAPSRQLPAISAALREKLRQNQRCLYLNSRPMVAGLKSQLAADGLDVEAEMARGSLMFSSEQTHLVGDWEFDVSGMIRSLKRALEDALQGGYSGLWATGDMSWEFGPAKDFSKLLEYEWRLERFIRENPQMGGICQYHAASLPQEVLRTGLIAHGSLFVNQTLSMINPHFLKPGSLRPAASAGTDLDGFIHRVLTQVPVGQAI